MRTFGYYYAIGMGMICLYLVVPGMILGAALHFRSLLIGAIGLVLSVFSIRRFMRRVTEMGN